jgi:hypothetical protein
VCIETVADLPVIWANLQRIDFVGCCDRLFPPPLSWKGPLTVGEVLAVWGAVALFGENQGKRGCLYGLPALRLIWGARKRRRFSRQRRV